MYSFKIKKARQNGRNNIKNVKTTTTTTTKKPNNLPIHTRLIINKCYAKLNIRERSPTVVRRWFAVVSKVFFADSSPEDLKS